MRQMFESGDCAEMGGSCFLLWCCLRTFSDFNTGIAYPSIDTLSKLVDQSSRSTSTQLNKLEDLGYIQRYRKSGKNYYRVIDKYQIEEMQTGNEETSVEVPYVPQRFTKGLSALKQFRENEISPIELEKMGIKVSMPQVIINNYYVQGDNNTISTNQVVINKQDSPAQDNEEVLRQLIAQRDGASNSMERTTAERWIDIIKNELKEEQEVQADVAFAPSKKPTSKGE